jgi:hypothetical protein
VSDAPDKRPRSIHLDELERISGPASLTWLPVRATLGIRAFGTNAYTAGKAGDDVVEPHTEDDELAHEELYFVARGHARFTIDGETIDAPAGTYVFIPDPASHRHAVAEEEGTTVLSFGGPANFTPSAWEWHFRATPLFESDPARAREILDDGLRTHPESPSLHYYLAAFAALQGNRGEAIEKLRFALERAPGIAEEARKEKAFEGLWEDPEFRTLIGG